MITIFIMSSTTCCEKGTHKKWQNWSHSSPSWWVVCPNFQQWKLQCIVGYFFLSVPGHSEIFFFHFCFSSLLGTCYCHAIGEREVPCRAQHPLVSLYKHNYKHQQGQTFCRSRSHYFSHSQCDWKKHPTLQVK